MFMKKKIAHNCSKKWYWHWVNIIHFYSKWKICFIVADNYLSAGSCMETVVTQCDNQINGRINNQQPIKRSLSQLSLQSHWPTQLLFLAFYISYEPDKCNKHRRKCGAISSVELKLKGLSRMLSKVVDANKRFPAKDIREMGAISLVSNWFWRHSFCWSTHPLLPSQRGSIR